jgi:hypothetical protein
MYEAPFSNQYACMLVTKRTLLPQASVGSEQDTVTMNLKAPSRKKSLLPMEAGDE